MIRARSRLLPPDHTTPPRSNGREPPSRSSGRREHLPIQATDRESASWRQGSERQCRRRVRRACEAWHRTRVRRRRPHPTAQRPPTGTGVGEQKSERVWDFGQRIRPVSWAGRPMNRHRPRRRVGPRLGSRDLLHLYGPLGPCLLSSSSSKPLRPTGPQTPPSHRVAMQRVSQLALRRLLSPPSAAAAARRAAPVTAEAVSGGGSVLLPRGGGAGVHPRPSLRFSGSGFHPSASNSCLSSHDSCDIALGSSERVEWWRPGALVGSEALHLRRERYIGLRWLHFCSCG